VYTVHLTLRTSGLRANGGGEMTAADFVRRSMNAIMGRKVEQYITVFGWTKADFRTDAQLTRFLEVLDHNRISRGSDWTVGFDGEARSLQEAGLGGSRSAILRQNELVAGEVGTLFQTRDGVLSFLLNRTPADGGWINQVTGTASSRLFQTSESAIEYVDFVLSLCDVLDVEYLIAAEAAEERAAEQPKPRHTLHALVAGAGPESRSELASDPSAVASGPAIRQTAGSGSWRDAVGLAIQIIPASPL
jgi:hypothetical protein